MASVRSWQKVPPCPSEPMPVSSRMDLLLAEIKPVRNDRKTSGITDIKTKKKVIAQL